MGATRVESPANFTRLSGVSPAPAWESGMMMTCLEVDQWMAEYLIGALPWPEREEFERHLAVCHACKHRLDSLEQTAATIRRYLRRSSEPRPQDVPDALVRSI